MVRLLARVVGIGVERADLLVHARGTITEHAGGIGAPARYPDLTGAPDESGPNGVKRDWPARVTRVRRCIIQLAPRFLKFQKDSALAEWYRQRTANAPSMRKTFVVA
jgi:transposase